MAYCTPAYFIRNYDSRFVRENLSDSGTPVADADLADNENLLQILAEASEMIAAAAEVGERYTSAQLAALAALTDGGYLLKRLTADIAFGLIVSRRGRSSADVARLAPRYGEALRQLEALRTGANLFPGVSGNGHEEAGLPAVASLTTTNSLSTRARRLFPGCDDGPLSTNCNC